MDDGLAHSDCADLTGYWEQVLGRAELGDPQAADAFAFVIHESGRPPPPSLVIAVARRLADTPDPEPWLAEWACRIADAHGESNTLGGFAALVAQSAGYDPTKGRMRHELLAESKVLAETLATRWAEPSP